MSKIESFPRKPLDISFFRWDLTCNECHKKSLNNFKCLKIVILQVDIDFWWEIFRKKDPGKVNCQNLDQKEFHIYPDDFRLFRDFGVYHSRFFGIFRDFLGIFRDFQIQIRSPGFSRFCCQDFYDVFTSQSPGFPDFLI